MNRIDALRAQFDTFGIDAFYIPKVDEFMGEDIRPCDERLQWISGFTGSAGFAVITRDRAALFVDGRYTFQAKAQAPDFEIVDIPQNDLTDWLGDERLGYDTQLANVSQVEKWQKTLGERLIATPNLIDPIWTDRPAPEPYQLREMPLDLAGMSTQDKLAHLTEILANEDVDAFLSNNPESLAWLLNIRGGEIAMLPAPMVI